MNPKKTTLKKPTPRPAPSVPTRPKPQLVGVRKYRAEPAPPPPTPVPLQAGEIAIAQAARLIMFASHEAASRGGWWNDLATGVSIRETRNVGETLMLIVSEVSEAMEGHRKGLMDDHLPYRTMLEVELADAMIRICDLAEARGLDLGGALVEKLAYNATRADHKPEARRAAGGKGY